MPLEEFFPSPPGGETSPAGRLVDLATETAGTLPAGAIGPHAANHEQGGADPVSSLPTADEKAALAGTVGVPSDTNRYATNGDERFEINGDYRLKRAKAGEDWAVAVEADKQDDSNNGAPISVYQFDAAIEEGVGYEVPAQVPSNTSKVVFHFTSRAEVAPPAARTVGVKVYVKRYPDNAAVTAWSAGLQLSDIDIPANEFWQYDFESVTLAALGVAPGELVRFEWTRIAPAGGVNLAGDWTVLESGGIGVRFE